MSIDGIAIRAVVHELEELLIGGRVTKIYQPGEADLILHIRNRGRNRRLLLSAHPAYPRLHLTEQATENPLTPPMFCMLLRKHCEGGVIEGIRQVGMERIIHMDLRCRDELGDEVIRRLVVEVMGRHSNIILIDPASGKILDGIRRVTPDISRHRQVLPGLLYQAPPEQDKKIPWLPNGKTFSALSISIRENWIDRSWPGSPGSAPRPPGRFFTGAVWEIGNSFGPLFTP